MQKLSENNSANLQLLEFSNPAQLQKQSKSTPNKSGKLFSEDQKKEAVKTKKDEVETLQNSCAGILEQQFTDKDKELFQTYKDADDKTKQEKLTKEQEELKKLEADLATLQKLNKKYAEINRISAVSQIVFSNPFSSKATFTELFTRQIKEKAQDEADEKIKTHFAKHRQFIEYAKDQIPKNYTGENCPLCMQPLANATKVIEYYRAVFDQTYENANANFYPILKRQKASWKQ